MNALKKVIIAASAIAAACISSPLSAQAPKTDSNTPLHLLQPDYNVPYTVPGKADVKSVLDRVLVFLDKETPAKLATPDRLQQGSFRLASYEWGVTYSAMLSAAQATGDKAYDSYTFTRHKFIADQAPHFSELLKSGARGFDGQMRQVLAPGALDDSGAMCMSMIKTQLLHPEVNLRPLIDNYIDYILNKQFRLEDGIFARVRPIKNSVWLDDMYMGIPAVAWYGKLTGDGKYFDEAARQILLFKKRMWVEDKALFRHGWVEAMDYHPAFHWARANGWAILCISEVLDVLPANHPDRPEIMSLYKEFVASLCALQSGEGFWHQLLDRNDSYLETSATAIYAGCIAHGICAGWLDAAAFGPSAILAWNAVTTKVTAEGMVEGTCVGTGMAFDPAYYYYRPTSPYAAHGYGPVIMAGAEIINLLGKYYPRLNDSAIQFYTRDYSSMGAIFSEPE